MDKVLILVIAFLVLLGFLIVTGNKARGIKPKILTVHESSLCLVIILAFIAFLVSALGELEDSFWRFLSITLVALLVYEFVLGFYKLCFVRVKSE